MIDSVPLDTIRTFVAFADRLNFTHAAEHLHISQPALFAKIGQLSEQLGVPLYTRRGRRLELTSHGALVARFGRELEERSRVFVDTLHSGASRQPVVLAAGEGAFLYLLGGAIRDFIRRAEVPLRLLTLNREGVLDAIESGRAHLGVASIDTVPPGVKATLLCKLDQMLVMPNNHPLARKRRVTLSSLRHERLVVPPASRPHRQMLAAALQSAGVDWEVAVEASGWELMLHFVRLGLGLAVVNSHCKIPRGLTARVLSELPQIHYHLFHLEGAAESEPVARLAGLLTR